MDFLQQIANKIPSYVGIKSSYDNCNTSKVVLSGLASIHKSHIIHSLCADKKHRAFVVVPDEIAVRVFLNDLECMGTKTLYYPYRDLNLHGYEGMSKEYEHKRLNCLNSLINKQYDVLVTTIDALTQYTIPKNILEESRFTLKLEEDISINDFINNLVKIGYESFNMVEGVGQFSHRGDIVDIFSHNYESPIRIEFFGDTIDSIYHFDALTQRREKRLNEVDILPVSEVIFENTDDETILASKSKDKFLSSSYKSPQSLLSYICDSDFIFISEENKCRQNFSDCMEKFKSEINTLVEKNILSKKDKFSCEISLFDKMLDKHFVVFLDNFPSRHNIKLDEISNINAVTLPLWTGSIKSLTEEINEYSYNGKNSSIILCGAKVFAKNTYSELQKTDLSKIVYSENLDDISHGVSYITDGALSSSFRYPEIGIQVISHGYIKNKKASKKSKQKNTKSITGLDELNVGDYVVHNLHGIGKFCGIKTIKVQDIVKDYIKISYAKDDNLYVPVTQLDMVSKYIGAKDNKGVKLNRLGSQDWSNTKRRAKLQAKDIAKDLIKIYSQRVKSKGHAFPNDTEWQKDFEASFPYEETDAQLRCIEEIKQDMQKPYPMDRLLCGDVGFGKTEVALRAAFKCVSDSKQCAILVPTTILAWQHYNNILERFKDFPVNVEMISRFRTKKQQTKILNDLKNGDIDILIGTHRIVQDDVIFKDLGLLVVDEEQRFGVLQKEKLKKLSSSTDILTMSATPIPRTLNMAISGIRDMSSLEEAPHDRYPVQTYVLEYDESILFEAIEKEIARGGQVYFLHNRIGSIDNIAYKIQKAIPSAVVGVGHSKMSEDELSEVWGKLIDGQINVLVCTTIIESGVDVPNANTLIVDNADMMGLSQLYQIRGRVGRSTRRAYAYFTYKRDKSLSEISVKRLNAIRDFTEFGSGFKISMRDLELRGAGNILGGEQHGHMESVGYDMYIKLLSEAVEEEKGEVVKDNKKDCLIDIEMQAHIPENYIQDLNQRLSIYRKISDIKSNDDASDIIDELIDRYGDIPSSVTQLVDAMLVRNIASKLSIYEIKQNKELIFLNLTKPNMSKISNLVAHMGRAVMFNAGSKPYISIKLSKDTSPLLMVKQAIELLE